MEWINLAQDRDICECGNKPPGSIKYGDLLDCLRDYFLVKNDIAPQSLSVSQLVNWLVIDSNFRAHLVLCSVSKSSKEPGLLSFTAAQLRFEQL